MDGVLQILAKIAAPVVVLFQKYILRWLKWLFGWIANEMKKTEGRIVALVLLVVFAFLALAGIFSRRYDESFLSSLLRIWNWIINFAIEFPLFPLFFLYLIDNVVKFRKKKKAEEEYAATISGLNTTISELEAKLSEDITTSKGEIERKINEANNEAVQQLKNEDREYAALIYEEVGDLIFKDDKYEDAIYFYVNGINALTLVDNTKSFRAKMDFVRKIDAVIEDIKIYEPDLKVDVKRKVYFLRILRQEKETLNEPITSVVNFIDNWDESK